MVIACKFLIKKMFALHINYKIFSYLNGIYAHVIQVQDLQVVQAQEAVVLDGRDRVVRHVQGPQQGQDVPQVVGC